MAYLQKFLATYYPECARMGNDFEEENPKSVTPLKYNRQRSSRPPSAFELTGLRPSRNRSNSSAIIAMPPDNEAPKEKRRMMLILMLLLLVLMLMLLLLLLMVMLMLSLLLLLLTTLMLFSMSKFTPIRMRLLNGLFQSRRLITRAFF